MAVTVEMKNRVREFIKFTASSLAGTVVDLGLFWILTYFLRGQVTGYIMISTVISRIFAILVNYNINAKFVFKDNDERKLPFAKYMTLAIIDMVGSGLLVSWLYSIIGWNETIIKMAVDATLFFVDYWIQKKIIF